MKKKLRMWWVIASAAWLLVMLNMSFHDLKYGLQYHLFHGRVEADFRAKQAAYEQARREGEEGIRLMLHAAKRYDDLQFLSLAAKRNMRPSRVPAAARKENAAGEPQSEYERTLDEIATLEQTYGKATLRQYREQDSQTEKILQRQLHDRLTVPSIRESRLAAVLFHMVATPLALLLALLIHEKAYRRLPKLALNFRVKRRS
jgi:hypothetical protein